MKSSNEFYVVEAVEFLTETTVRFLRNDRILQSEHDQRFYFCDFHPLSLERIKDKKYFTKMREQMLGYHDYINTPHTVHIHNFGLSLFVGYFGECVVRPIPQDLRHSLLRWARDHSVIFDDRNDLWLADKKPPLRFDEAGLPENVIKIAF